jgi:hypothetical protein
MLAPTLMAMALIRFGFGRGGGMLFSLLILIVVGMIVWALAWPKPKDQGKG